MSTRSRNNVVDFALRGPLVGAQRGALVAALVVAGAAVLTGIWMPIDQWGALAAWAGTVGTLIAVAVAVATARHEAETAAVRAREEQAEREIQQARLVTVELSYPSGMTTSTATPTTVAWLSQTTATPSAWSPGRRVSCTRTAVRAVGRSRTYRSTASTQAPAPFWHLVVMTDLL